MPKPFQPQNPDFRARTFASFARQPAMAAIGATMTDAQAGKAHIELHVDGRHGQQHGLVHGGIVAMVAEGAAGYAAFTLMPSDASVLTVEYKINFLAPSSGPILRAEGRVLRPGRSLTVVVAEVFAMETAGERLTAVLQGTVMTMQDMADTPRAAHA